MNVQRLKLLDCDLEKRVLSGPLSRVTTYALHITGPLRVTEMDNLIKVLQLHRSWLLEDEYEKPPIADQ